MRMTKPGDMIHMCDKDITVFIEAMQLYAATAAAPDDMKERATRLGRVMKQFEPKQGK